MRDVSLIVAWVFSMSQVAPAASAYTTLRPTATDSGGAEGQIQKDTAWAWGPLGVDPIGTLGRANLVSLGKQIVEAAFEQSLAFPLVGPGARPIEELVNEYAAGLKRRIGKAPTKEEQTAFANRLARLKDGIEKALANEALLRIQSLESPSGQLALHVSQMDLFSAQEKGHDITGAPRPQDLVRFVFISNEAGIPALVAHQGVPDNATHHALIAYGGEHTFAGWDQAKTPTVSDEFRQTVGPKSVYLSLELLEGMLEQSGQGNANAALLRHEVNDVFSGSHRDEPKEVQVSINQAISKVYQKTQQAREQEYIKERKAAAAKAAKSLTSRVQLVPYVMSLGRFFADGRVPDHVLGAVRAGLDQAKRDKTIVDFHLKRLGGEVFLQVDYNGPDRNPAVDRRITTLVAEAVNAPDPAAPKDVTVNVSDDVAKVFTGLFGDKPINDRTVNVEQVIGILTQHLGSDIPLALAARRKLLDSKSPAREKYAFPKGDDTFSDADGNVRTFNQIVQGMIDNFLGRRTKLAWRLNDEVPIPDDIHPLKDPGLQITGPSHPIDMAINQLNAEVSDRMPDLEDASASWYVPAGAPKEQTVGAFEGIKNESELLAGEWDEKPYRVVKKGQAREYRLTKPRGERPTTIQRVPSIHLLDRHITVNGKPVPAIVIGYVVHLLNTYGALKKNDSGNYYYQPKIQTPQEALVVEKLPAKLEDLTGLARGTIKLEALYEEGNAGRFLAVIPWVWRHRLIGTNVGRWDYLGSLFEMLKDMGVFPDPQSINMASPNMIVYQRINALIMLMAGMKNGELTNAAPIGGMAAVMLYPPTDPYGRHRNNPKALRAMKMDKLRERLLGLIFVPDEPLADGQVATLEDILAGRIKGRLYDTYRQSWVATPDKDYVAAGTVPLRTPIEELQALIDAPTEEAEIDGKKVPTVASGLIDGERKLLTTLGLLNSDGKIRPWVITKEQFDTPEKLFSQELWDSLYSIPKGDITIEHVQHAFYMAANYGFQILNGNYAAAIDDYELGLRFMNDLATYRIFVGWLWTVFHHQAAITKDGWLKKPVLDPGLGVIPGENAIELKKGTRMTPEVFQQLWDLHNQWTEVFFAEQDRRGEEVRFDRSKAPVIMDILRRQLLSPRYLQHSPRVLFTVAEAGDQQRAQILEAIFSESREAVVQKVKAGQVPESALKAHDYVYDHFPEEEAAARRQLLAAMPYSEQVKALAIRTGEFPFNERGAEPIYVSIAKGGNISAYNWPIMKLLNEAVENQLKIEGVDQAGLGQLKADHQRYLDAVQLGDHELATWLEANKDNLAKEVESEGPGYTVIVERVADLVAGKRDRTAYAFVFPRSAPYIHTLVNDQTEWVITRVLPRPGSRLYDRTKRPLEQDPMVVVMVDGIGESVASESFTPVLVAKQQSGAPAVGEFNAATTNFFIATAGPNGKYHRGVVPVTAEEAEQGTFDGDGRVQMISYSYQSNNNGHIPPRGVRDQVALSNDIMPIRDDQKWVHDALILHGSFQPHTTAPAALATAEETAHELGARFHQIPGAVELDAEGRPLLGPDKKPRTKLDPILEASNRTQVLTLSDLKADIGADPGHQLPVDLYFATLRASLKAAQRAGLIKAYDVQNIGDDMHLWIVHDKGVDSAEIHTLAWHSFFRSGWVLKKVGYPDLKEGYKPYGFMQDLVDPNVKKLIDKGKLEAFANLTDEFIEALKEEIQAYPEEAANLPNILRAYDDYKTQKAAGTVIELPFAGNVRGQGIGFAEKTIAADEAGQWTVIASDKAGPGAFNRRMYWATRLALLAAGTSTPEMANAYHWYAEVGKEAIRREVDEKLPEAPAALRAQFAAELGRELLAENPSDGEFALLRQRLANGLVYEVWDVKANTRILLDAERDDEQILKLLSAVNDFNIKRVWTKKQAGWIDDLTPEERARINQQVEARREAIREEITHRKQEVQGMLARGEKTKDQLTPWDIVVVEQPLEEALARALEEEREALKAREFLGDDYLASFSTEKLAVAGGGQYLGKDDPTSWIFEPIAKLYRAVTAASPSVILGDARGSHWVAIRPETRTTSVAVAWSNPVENAFRIVIGEDGVVAVDSQTGWLATEDLYTGKRWDEVRATVARFDKILINTQGGFTPRGPNIGDVESAYPYKTTTKRLADPKSSPFALPITDVTVQQVEQGKWAEQFSDAVEYTVSPAVAEAAADLNAHQWVVVHSAVFSQGPDAAIALARLQEQIETVLRGGPSAVHFALVMDGTTTAEQAEEESQRLFEAVGEGSRQTAELSREQFELVLPDSNQTDPDVLLGLLRGSVPGSRVGTVIGPAAWAQALKANGQTATQPVVAIVVEPAAKETQVVSGASAIVAGVEAAASGGRLPPQLAAKLDIFDEAGVLVPKTLEVEAELADDVTAYQTAVRAAGKDV